MISRLAVFLCIDGCAPEYLHGSNTPNMDLLASNGQSQVLMAMTPTVTNVNHATLVTGLYPDRHGISGNYGLTAQGQAHFVEDEEYLREPTIFQRLGGKPICTAFLTVKEKLRRLLSRGSSLSVSAEEPPGWLVDAVGTPPPIYSLEVNYWIFHALQHILRELHGAAFVYITTTDYPQHLYEPDSKPAREFINTIDGLLGRLLDFFPDADVAITADHGMNSKERGVDLEKVLAARGIEAVCIPIIRDRHVIHHRNLGGAVYVYLRDKCQPEEAVGVLHDVEGLEGVYSREEAARLFHLPPDRIGDLLVFGDRITVLGALDEPVKELKLRSHGSLHERDVPLIATGRFKSKAPFEDTMEFSSWVIQRVMESILPK